MKQYALAAAVMAASASSQAALIISEIVDAPLPGGLPKYVELTNTGNASVDLSLYSIGNYNNGSTNLAANSTTLSGTLAAGDSYVISYENGDQPGTGTFYDTYGFDADNFELGSFINGNDVVALFQGTATGDGSDAALIDIFGVPGVDGTGENWEYTDSYAYRLNTVLDPSAVFDANQWYIPGANGLETGDDSEELALILANTTPGEHTVVPVPAAVWLFASGLLGMAGISRRRKN